MTFQFTSDPWRWIRAGILFGVVVIAVLVWNPRFTIAGIWNYRERGVPAQQDKNALSALFLGLTVIGCLESIRDGSALERRPRYRVPWRQVWVHLGSSSQHHGFWVELDDGTFAEFDAMDMSEWFIRDHSEMLKKPGP